VLAVAVFITQLLIEVGKLTLGKKMAIVWIVFNFAMAVLCIVTCEWKWLNVIFIVSGCRCIASLQALN
jgi:hypothetical protein